MKTSNTKTAVGEYPLTTDAVLNILADFRKPPRILRSVDSETLPVKRKKAVSTTRPGSLKEACLAKKPKATRARKIVRLTSMAKPTPFHTLQSAKLENPSQALIRQNAKLVDLLTAMTEILETPSNLSKVPMYIARAHESVIVSSRRFLDSIAKKGIAA